MKHTCEKCRRQVKHTRLKEHNRIFYYVCKKCYKAIKAKEARDDFAEKQRKQLVTFYLTLTLLLIMIVAFYVVHRSQSVNWNPF